MDVLRKMRQEVREKDSDIEFLEFLVREKSRKVNTMQQVKLDQNKTLALNETKQTSKA